MQAPSQRLGRLTVWQFLDELKYRHERQDHRRKPGLTCTWVQVSEIFFIQFRKQFVANQTIGVFRL